MSPFFGGLGDYETRIGAVIEGEQNLDQVAAAAGSALDSFKGNIVVFNQAAALAERALDGVQRAAQKVQESISEQKGLLEWSDRLGIAVDQLDALNFVGERAGIGINEFDTALQRMVRRVAEAAKGTGEAKDAIAELGIDAKEFVKLPVEEMLLRIGDALQKIPDQADRVRILFKLFDTEGVSMAQVFASTRDEIEATMERARSYGIVTREMAEEARDAAARQIELQRAIRGVRDELVNKMLESIDDTKIKQVTDLLHAFEPIAGKTTEIAVTIGVGSGKVMEFLEKFFLSEDWMQNVWEDWTSGIPKDVINVRKFIQALRDGTDAAEAARDIWGEAAKTVEATGNAAEKAVDPWEAFAEAASKHYEFQRKTTIEGGKFIDYWVQVDEKGRNVGDAFAKMDHNAQGFLATLTETPPEPNLISSVSKNIDDVNGRWDNLHNFLRDADKALMEDLVATSNEFGQRLALNAQATVDRLTWTFGQSVAHGRDWGDAMLSVIQDFVGAAIAELVRLAAVMTALGLLRAIGITIPTGGSPGGPLGDFPGTGGVTYGRNQPVFGPRGSGLAGDRGAPTLNVTFQSFIPASKGDMLGAARYLRGLLQEAG